MSKLLRTLLLMTLALVVSIAWCSPAMAKVTTITGYNTNANNGGIVPFIAQSSGNAIWVKFEWYDQDADEWFEITTDTTSNDGWKALWDTGHMNEPGVDVRASDSINPGDYFMVSLRVQNVMPNDMYGYRNPSSGIVKVTSDYTISGQTITWPANFPISESADRYSYNYSYTSFGSKTQTPVAGNLTTIRSDFTQYQTSSSGTLKWKAFTGTNFGSMTRIAESGSYTMNSGLQTYSVNWLNIPAGTYIGMYYGTYYNCYTNRYDYNQTSTHMSVYGYVVYQYGDTGSGSYYSYNYYTGSKIEFTISTYPPDVTQMELGYSRDDGASWTTVANGVPSTTKPNTYDFTWNSQDLVGDNILLGVRAFAGTWCSWYYKDPISFNNRLFVSVSNNLGFGTVMVEGSEYNVPYTGNWYYQTGYEIEAPLAVSKPDEEGRRYAFESWSDDGSRIHDASMVWGKNPLIQATYVQEVFVSVTTAYDTASSFAGWLPANTFQQFSVHSPQDIDESTRFVCSGWTGTGSIGDGTGPDTGEFFLRDPSTINFHWFPEYMLRIYNDHGDNTGVQPGWYADGSILRAMSTEFKPLPASSRYRCIGWFAAGSLANGVGIDTGNFVIDRPTTITWIFNKQYGITIRTNHGTTTPEGTIWVSENNLITVDAAPPADTATEKFTWRGWTYPGGGTTPTGETSLVYRVTQAGTIYAWWDAEYWVNVTTNGSFPATYSGWYLEGTELTITSNPPAAGEGHRYLLSWVADGVGMTNVAASPATPNPFSFDILNPANIQALWVAQVSVQVLDPVGAAVSPIPAPGTYWMFAGEVFSGRVDFSYQGIVCTGYTGTGSIPSGVMPYFSEIITVPSTVTWQFDLRDTSLAPSPTWRDPATVATNAFGSGCSIAHSPDGSPVIAYTGAPVADGKADGKYEHDSIRLGWVRNDQWVVDIIDSDGTFGTRVAVVLDSVGNPSVAYIKDSEATVARFVAGAWIIEVLSASLAAENYIDLAIDEDGNLHAAFYTPSESALVYSSRIGGVWTTEIVDNQGNVGLYCSIGVMPILKWPSIAYYDSTNRILKFARLEDGEWAISVVDDRGDVGRNGNLALDPSGVPYVCYQTVTEPANIGLRIAWLLPEGWTNIDLATNNITGYDISIAIDDQGVIHISYRNYASLQYSWYNGVAWGLGNSIAGTSATGMTDVTVDAEGNPSIVFWDGGDLKYVDTVAGAYNGPMDVDNTVIATAGGGGGCFVATAAFGSLNASAVSALTGARDAALAASANGSSLVALYYSVSPVPAAALRNSSAVRALAREFLD